MHPGDVFAGRFVLERLAGAGGMGAVWRALDRVSGEPIALKVILNPDEEQIARFQREERVLAGLEHPAIARHVDHGVTSDGRHYLAMEWLEGEDLAARLSRGALGVDESLALAECVADALAVVHGRGVVHRDLKPANLFLPQGDLGQVKLLDFGIARLSDATQGLTATGAAIGTPAYMAPEQARGEPGIDARADVYALGCVLFECLTGRPPFIAGHPLAVLASQLERCP
jgi:serine/threonine protein kinase